jgi:hypothetical protein
MYGSHKYKKYTLIPEMILWYLIYSELEADSKGKGTVNFTRVKENNFLNVEIHVIVATSIWHDFEAFGKVRFITREVLLSSARNKAV